MFNIPCISHSEVILSQVIVQGHTGWWLMGPCEHRPAPQSFNSYFEYDWDSLPCTRLLPLLWVQYNDSFGHVSYHPRSYCWGHIVQSHIFQGHTGQWMAYGSMWTPQSFNSYFEYNWDVLPGTDFYKCYAFNMMRSLVIFFGWTLRKDLSDCLANQWPCFIEELGVWGWTPMLSNELGSCCPNVASARSALRACGLRK